MQFALISDRVGGDAGPPDVSGLLGVWVNSNPETQGVARVVLTESGGRLSLRAQAVGPDGLIDWGEADVRAFSSSPSSGAAAGFACRFDFGFAEVLLQAMILKGLIVLAQFHTFKDASGRADFFVREYFALDHGRY
jgi:hypothetical protein